MNSIRNLLMVTILISAFICSMPARAAGSDGFGDDPDDAVKGHVYVRALIEEGHDTDVTVELLPYSTGGVGHRYVLNGDNGYGMSDDIRIGEYEFMGFASGDDVYVSHIPGSVTVTEDSSTYFIVVAGSEEFANEYTWLAGYETDNGGRLSGIITHKDAARYFDNTVAAQTGEPLDTDDEIAGQEDPGTGDTEEIYTPVPEEPDDSRDGRRIPAAAGVLIPALIIAAAVFIAAKRKGGS